MFKSCVTRWQMTQQDLHLSTEPTVSLIQLQEIDSTTWLENRKILEERNNLLEISYCNKKKKKKVIIIIIVIKGQKMEK